MAADAPRLWVPFRAGTELKPSGAYFFAAVSAATRNPHRSPMREGRADFASLAE